ncbi:MAG: hypothetical protein GAK36_00315 [Pseudomonas sp.]|nr:MAG: hypothetical protein GAK36_00315 [Pseudomonas sp.]
MEMPALGMTNGRALVTMLAADSLRRVEWLLQPTEFA